MTAEDAVLYEDLVLHMLYYRYVPRFGFALPGPGEAATDRGGAKRVAFYREFVREAEEWLRVPGLPRTTTGTPEHMIEMFFQIRRAFGHIYWNLVGTSPAMAKLRAAVWQSIFTHDLRRYRRTLYSTLTDMTTLVMGPSGTGKEVVARAIACSRHIPFDAKKQEFVEDYREVFWPLNLSALSPTLIESELFGHRRGAFTGAVEDRVGWLEVCTPRGTVFLDEIGELDGQIQVKLLRVLQSRVFQRLGDTAQRRFEGKIIAATNRDLAAEMKAGRFREDFYYRICSDIVRTPSLREQIAEGDAGGGELRFLVRFIAERVAGEEAPALTDEVMGWIEHALPGDYAWPGNFRELEQCVRNVLIRKEYHPPTAAPGAMGDVERLVEGMREGRLTMAELERGYMRLVYGQTGSYVETARRLGVNRRTVKARLAGAD